jgi:Fe-S cluster assembly protein SufB
MVTPMEVEERTLTEEEVVSSINQQYAEKYGFADAEDYVFKAEKGLNEEVIRNMSAMKNEPEWMLEYRLKAYQHFLERPMPNWGADLSGIKFDDIYYYIKPSNRQEDDWEDVPSYIKDTFNKLGIPEAEQNSSPALPPNMNLRSFTTR